MTGSHNVYRRFEAVAECHARRYALAFRVGSGWSVWSYADLISHSGVIEGKLREAGVGKGSAVGLVVHRYPETIATMIAVLAIGAHFVPLDPLSPESRTQWLIEEAGVQIVVTPRGARASGGLVDITTPASALQRASAVSPPSDVPDDPDDGSEVAYVMFTSGSTGHPKGVAVPHRAITRLVEDQDYVRFDESRVFLQTAPMNFDASIFEIWGALLHGGRCVLYPDSEPITALGLREVISKAKVTTAWLPASLFDAIVTHDIGCLDLIQELIVGGEALSVSHVRQAFAALPGIKIVNGYGPTENTTFTTCYAIPRDLPSSAVRIPIGRAINGTQVLIVDDDMQPVPAGIEGDLVALGQGLAIEYLGDAELNRASFSTVTLPDGTRHRCYRTGDRVVEFPDGLLDFHGRRDEQVKIHGYRIEPFEIETVVAGMQGVSQCRVVVDYGPLRPDRLIAYVVLRAPLWLNGLKRALADVLPEYMVPHSLIALPFLPLNANGKLACDKLASVAAEASGRRVSEMNLVEAAWSEVLGHIPSAADLNFFDAGGRSLEAIQLHALLERETKISLDPTFVYEFTTTHQQTRELIRLVAHAKGISDGYSNSLTDLVNYSG